MVGPKEDHLRLDCGWSKVIKPWKTKQWVRRAPVFPLEIHLQMV